LAGRKLAILILAIFAFQVTLSFVHAQTTETLQIGKGNFTLPIVNRNGLTGKYLTLSDYLGKVIVLEFMSPWCPPCQKTVPIMESLYNQFAPQGAVFIAVAEPLGGDAASHYRNVTMTEFFSNHTTSLTYVIDHSGWLTGNMYGVQSVPTLFIISKAGSIVTSYMGYDGIANAQAKIAETLSAQLGTPVPEFSNLLLMAILPLLTLQLLQMRLRKHRR